MDGTTLQAKVYAGYAKAAQRAGTPFAQYRPLSPGPVVAPGNYLGTLAAVFDGKPGFQFAAPAGVGKPFWYALLDGRRTSPGDCLTAASGTYFLASQQPIEPIMAVRCNAVVNILRPTPNSGFGAQPYGGDIATVETPVITGWPAALLQGTKGEKGETNLPGDVRMPWFAVMLAAYPGAQIEAADVMTDDLGRRFKVSGAELTSMGWRLTAMLAEA